MRLRNSTQIPNEMVRDVIRFVKPSGVSGFDVRLGYGSGIKGKAYFAGSAYHTTAAPFIVCYVGSTGAFPVPPGPVRSGGFGYLPRPYFADAIEAFVYLAAHELRHLWQANVPRGRRVWGSRGQFSERDACAYGIRMLRAWRKRNDGR